MPDPHPEHTIRPMTSAADYAACVELQESTWGRGFADLVPPSLLMIAQKVGGIVAGAFGPDRALDGFVLGFTGLRHGQPAHWSHMLAVRAAARDRGLGSALKRYQRGELLAAGIEVMYWTFDPLVARNAHLNLNRLGAEVESYVPDLYGPGEDSPVDRGIGTDRFIVRWRLTADQAAPRRGHRDPSSAVTVAIPADIQQLKVEAPTEAAALRATTRAAFIDHLARGWRVTGFERHAEGGGGVYVLEPAP